MSRNTGGTGEAHVKLLLRLMTNPSWLQDVSADRVQQLLQQPAQGHNL
jgi:hypothetical protein